MLFSMSFLSIARFLTSVCAMNFIGPVCRLLYMSLVIFLLSFQGNFSVATQYLRDSFDSTIRVSAAGTLDAAFFRLLVFYGHYAWGFEVFL